MEATERSLTNGGDNGAQFFALSAYYCIPLQPPLAYVIHSQNLYTSEIYRVAFTANVRVNRMHS